MRKKKVTKDYAAGVLESYGGFYVYYNKKRRLAHPRFKIVCCSQDKCDMIERVVLYLQEQGVHFLTYNNKNSAIYAISSYKPLEILLDFMDRNCILKKHNQDKIRELLETRKYARLTRTKNMMKEKEEIEMIIKSDKPKVI